MKRTKTAFFIVLAVLSLYRGFCDVYAKEPYSAEYKSSILMLVVPTHTTATLMDDCFLRTKPNYFSASESRLKKGTLVEVLQDSSESWYKVESADENAVGWLPARFLEIHPEQRQKLPEMSDYELEAFADIMNFPTPTGFFVWTDIARQKVHIFKQDNGYSLIRSFDCSSGKSTSPTTRGFFTINGRGDWFYSSRFDSGAMYWVRFNGTYLFHSVAMDRRKNVTDGTLGERRSNGCVRLSIEDAKWLCGNVPDGSTVFVY